MASVSPSRVRSLYRSLLRELPPLSEKPRSPLHAELRKAISSPAAPIEEADQLLSYLRSQRMYTTLIERYNPSLNMDTDERVRLSARRVGFDLPESN